MESEDFSLYDSFRYRVLDEMVEDVKALSSYFILVVDKKSLGIVSGAVSVLDLTQRGVTVIEQLEKSRKPMPDVDVLYFLTPSHKSITRLTQDFIEQTPYRQVHVYFTGKVNDKLMRTIANSSVMPHIKTFKEANCGFRVLGQDCFSLEYSGLASNLYTPRSAQERKEILSFISQNLASVLGVMHDLPYISYHSSSVLAQEFAGYLESDLSELYRKVPDLKIHQNRPVMLILDRSYDMAIPFVHDIHYEALLKDLFEVGPDGKVKYESNDNSGFSSIKEAIINEKDPVWVRLRYEEVDEAQDIMTKELKSFRNENQVIEHAANDPSQGDLKTMAKVVSGLSNYNETVNKFAVHRFLLNSCLKTFADDGITELAEVGQMLLTGFNNEKKEYKESDLIEKVVAKMQSLSSDKEKLRIALAVLASVELSPNDRKSITDLIAPTVAASLTKLQHFGISIQPASRSKKRMNKVYLNTLQARTPQITKIYNYAIPKLKDFIQAAGLGNLDAEGFVFGRSAPPAVEDLAPQVKSLRKKQGAAPKGKRKVIVFILGGVSYAELRILKDFPDMRVVIGGTKAFSPLEFVTEIMQMSRETVNEDIDPRDIELDFR
jgi:hypothetical protein